MITFIIIHNKYSGSCETDEAEDFLCGKRALGSGMDVEVARGERGGEGDHSVGA